MADRTPSRRSSTTSRRTLRRQSSRGSTNASALDIFGDEHAVDFDPVSDGFRPDSTSNFTSRLSSQADLTPNLQPPPRAASPPRVTEYLKKRLAGQERASGSANRSSLSVSRRESIRSYRTPSSSAETADRPLSSISGLSTPASEHAYTIAGGPYATYPQVSSLNRSTSTSTVQTQNRPYNGPNRPTHPYAMYPQIPQTASELDPFSDPADIANVGFPGLGQTYARRLGPDGEEADDLIGPDGHTEQLPPYTRFPQDMHPKQRAEVDDSEPLLTSAVPIASQAQAERHPEMSSTDSLLDNEEGVAINEGAARAAGLEDSNRAARWKEKSKKRTCWGKVPVWAWVLLVVILCALAATLGAVVGTSVAHMHPPQPTRTSTVAPISTGLNNEGASPAASTTYWATVTTTLVDATPLSVTPKNLPALPTGTFAIPIIQGGNQSNLNNCLRKAEERPGWMCNQQSFLSLYVQSVDRNTNYITLFAEYPEDYPLLYGAQAPTMRGPAIVQLVNDLEAMDAGPAYWFQQLYDKVVILKPSDLRAAVQENFADSLQGRSASARSTDDDDSSHMINAVSHALLKKLSSRHLEARDFPTDPVITGDKPWYCFWNSTILEGFIYAHHDSNPPVSETQFVASLAGDSMRTAAPSTAMPSGRQGRPKHAKRGRKLNEAMYLSASASAAAASASAGLPSLVYPKVVKIEERRSFGMPTPYCQQMIANFDGTIVPAKDLNGQKIRFNLTEISAIVQQHIQPNSSGDAEPENSKKNVPIRLRDDIFTRDFPGSETTCRCAWTFA